MEFSRRRKLYFFTVVDFGQPSATDDVTNPKKASLGASTANLVKNAVGAGIFSLNSRVSSIIVGDFRKFSNVIFLVFGMAAWAAYNFYIVAEACDMSSSKSFDEVWKKLVSEESSWVVQIITTVAPMISCLANTIVLTDVLRMMALTFSAPLWFTSNRKLMVAILCSVVLYPICILKDLSALKSVSLFGLGGQVIAMGALAQRLKDGSYKEGGRFAISIMENPQAVKLSKMSKSSQWIVLAAILSYCFVSHYNAPRYSYELDGKAENPNQVLKLAGISYALCAMIYLATIFLGVKLFGSRSASFALNSFDSSDPLASMAFLAFGGSVLASYPLLFFQMRNFFIQKAESSGNGVIKKMFGGISNMTKVLLILIGTVAAFVSDIGVVGSISGAIFGSSMMFILPPIVYINAIRGKFKAFPTIEKPLSYRIQVMGNFLLLIAGIAFTCVSAKEVISMLLL